MQLPCCYDKQRSMVANDYEIAVFGTLAKKKNHYNRKLIDEKVKIECSSIDDAQATCHYSLTDVFIPNILSHEFIHNLTVMYDFVRTGMKNISNIAVYYQSCIILHVAQIVQKTLVQRLA